MINIVAVIIYLILGFIFSKINKFPKNTSEVLNLLVIYVALPGLILGKFPFITLDSSAIVPLVSPWLMLIISCFFVLSAAKIFKFSKEITGCLLLVIPLGNTSFIGIPMIEGLLGPSALAHAIIYDQFGSFIILSTYGTVIVALYSSSQKKFSFSEMLKKIIIFPPFIALLVAIIFKLTALPSEEAIKIFSILGNMLVPLAMMSVGFQFKGSFEREDLSLIIGSLGFKLIAAPLILFSLLNIFTEQDLAMQTSVLEAGMPPQITAGAIAMSVGLAPKLAASVVGFGILFCFITLPTLKYFLF